MYLAPFGFNFLRDNDNIPSSNQFFVYDRNDLKFPKDIGTDLKQQEVYLQQTDDEIKSQIHFLYKN